MMVRARGGGMVGRAENPSDQQLESRCTALVELARVAGAQGRTEEQRRYSAESIAVVRLLLERNPADSRHLRALAGALYNQAGRMLHARYAEEAEALLGEARACYARLAVTEPRLFSVPLVDVRQRSARVRLVSHDWSGAAQLYREAVAAYRDAPTTDPAERDFGVVRAHTGLGCCLLILSLLGKATCADALEEFDAALFTAEGVRERVGIDATDFSWLAMAPPSFRQAAPEWMSAAVGAMELHDAAGNWSIAADAANIAVRVCAGLAATGDDDLQQRFEHILKRAKQIWHSAENPVTAAALRAGPYREIMFAGRGPAIQPDINRILTLAGWGDLRG